MINLYFIFIVHRKIEHNNQQILLTNQPGTCTQNPTYGYLTTATVPGFKHVYPRDNETALTNAIATIGPIGNQKFKKIIDLITNFLMFFY